MSKVRPNIFSYDISHDAQMEALFEPFQHALEAVQDQGYCVEYAGENLYQPGQIAIIGPPAIGKSTFLSEVLDRFSVEGASVEEKRASSADKTRDVLVWKQWKAPDESHAISLRDANAEAALIHLPEMSCPQVNAPGLVVFEHGQEHAMYCDMMLQFERHGQSRILEIEVSDDVLRHEAFSKNFLMEAPPMASRRVDMKYPGLDL